MMRLAFASLLVAAVAAQGPGGGGTGGGTGGGGGGGSGPGGSGSNKAFEADGIVVEKVGKSGKCLLRRPSGNATSSLVFEIDSMTTIDASGNKGAPFVNSLATSDFTVSNITDAKYKNISCKTISMTATNFVSAPNASLNVDIFIMSEEGLVTLGTGNETETTVIAKGSIKVDFSVSDWPFGANTTYLDVAYRMKGRNSEPKFKKDGRNNTKGSDSKSKKGKDRALDLGGGEVVVSEMVSVDGTYVLQPDGFPSADVKKGIFTVRIPKFSQSGGYDPVFTVEGSGSGAGSSAAAAAISGVLLAFVLSLL